MEDIARRTAVACLGSVTMAGLAGCSAGGLLGSSFEEGDEQAVMLEADWFGDGWEQTEEDDPGDTTETEGEEAESDDGDGSDDDLDLGFDPDEVPFAAASFEREDDDEISMALALVAVLDDEDEAEEGVEEFGRREMVNAEDPGVGDTAVRGEVDGISMLYHHLDNAAVLTGGASVVGFNLEPDHGRALDMSEEIEARLDDL